MEDEAHGAINVVETAGVLEGGVGDIRAGGSRISRVENEGAPKLEPCESQIQLQVLVVKRAILRDLRPWSDQLLPETGYLTTRDGLMTAVKNIVDIIDIRISADRKRIVTSLWNFGFWRSGGDPWLGGRKSVLLLVGDINGSDTT